MRVYRAIIEYTIFLGIMPLNKSMIKYCVEYYLVINMKYSKRYNFKWMEIFLKWVLFNNKRIVRNQFPEILLLIFIKHLKGV